MEKKMETTIMETQMEKKMENEMETGIIMGIQDSLLAAFRKPFRQGIVGFLVPCCCLRGPSFLTLNPRP